MVLVFWGGGRIGGVPFGFIEFASQSHFKDACKGDTEGEEFYPEIEVLGFEVEVASGFDFGIGAGNEEWVGSDNEFFVFECEIRLHAVEAVGDQWEGEGGQFFREEAEHVDFGEVGVEEVELAFALKAGDFVGVSNGVNLHGFDDGFVAAVFGWWGDLLFEPWV